MLLSEKRTLLLIMRPEKHRGNTSCVVYGRERRISRLGAIPLISLAVPILTTYLGVPTAVEKMDYYHIELDLGHPTGYTEQGSVALSWTGLRSPVYCPEPEVWMGELADMMLVVARSSIRAMPAQCPKGGFLEAGGAILLQCIAFAGNAAWWTLNV